MKYRIKITTFMSGRKEYKPYVKGLLSWRGLDCDGAVDGFTSTWIRRDLALSCIDKHYKGNTKRQSIEFEYITK